MQMCMQYASPPCSFIFHFPRIFLQSFPHPAPTSLFADFPSLPTHFPSLPTHFPSLPTHFPSIPTHFPSLPIHFPSFPFPISLNTTQHFSKPCSFNSHLCTTPSGVYKGGYCGYLPPRILGVITPLRILGVITPPPLESRGGVVISSPNISPSPPPLVKC